MVNFATTARAPRNLVVLAAAVAFAFLAGLAWRSTGPMAWERPVIGALAARPLPLRDLWIAPFEPVPFAALVAALAAATARRGRRRLAAAGAIGCVLAVLATEIVFKPLIDRVRIVTVTHAHRHRFYFSRPTFPSAHVTAAAALATFAWFALGRRTRLWPLLVAVPLVVGASVVSRRMHYPTDVLGGLLVGPTVVGCVVETARRHARRHPRRDPRPALETEPRRSDVVLEAAHGGPAEFAASNP